MFKPLDMKGFTLVELMITMVISGVIVASIYTAYTAQQKMALAQEQVVEMQQNIRAGLEIMTRDIRMAGYDPKDTCGAKIITATNVLLSVEICVDDDGEDNNNNGTTDEPGEKDTVTFDLYDAYADGSLDIGRTVGGNKRAIAENIDTVEFYYTLDDGTQTDSPGVMDAIRSVTVSILARANFPDPKFTNTKVYVPASGTAWDLNGAAAGNAANDNFRRRLLITTVRCRNMGLDS